MIALARICLESANRSEQQARQAHVEHDEEGRLYWEASAMRWMHLFRSCLVEVKEEQHAPA